MSSAAPQSYTSLLSRGAELLPGVRIGRPGRARTYRATTDALRVLRLRWKVEVDGAQHVAPGAAILVANHVAALDPLVVAMSTRWRVTAFTKAEWFQGPVSPFFRLMGQIPLRRGDAAATDWAIDMATAALDHGSKVGLYPEGTRSPDASRLHRLHGRVLIPVLRASTGTPVHAITTAYTSRGLRRTRVRLCVSPALTLDPVTMTDEELISVIREELLRLGGQTYVDESAHAVKQRLAQRKP